MNCLFRSPKTNSYICINRSFFVVKCFYSCDISLTTQLWHDIISPPAGQYHSNILSRSFLLNLILSSHEYYLKYYICNCLKTKCYHTLKLWKLYPHFPHYDNIPKKFNMENNNPLTKKTNQSCDKKI